MQASRPRGARAERPPRPAAPATPPSELASARSPSSTASRWPSPNATPIRPFCCSTPALEEVHRRAADEPGDEEVGGAVVELLRGGDLLQLALAHHRDPLPEGHRLDLIVRDVDRRHADLLVDQADLGPHLRAQLGVEVRERLVHQERLRLPDHAPGPSRRAGAVRPTAAAGGEEAAPRARAPARSGARARRSRSSRAGAASAGTRGSRRPTCADRARRSGRPLRRRGRGAAAR